MGSFLIYRHRAAGSGPAFKFPYQNPRIQSCPAPYPPFTDRADGGSEIRPDHRQPRASSTDKIDVAAVRPPSGETASCSTDTCPSLEPPLSTNLSLLSGESCIDRSSCGRQISPALPREVQLARNGSCDNSKSPSFAVSHITSVAQINPVFPVHFVGHCSCKKNWVLLRQCSSLMNLTSISTFFPSFS